MTKESKSVNSVSPEQINDWIKRHQEHQDKEAQEKLVKHYEKLIESLAYKYSKGQSHHEDLVQVGMVGLIGAINRFDLSFDRKFEAFLVPTVIGEIKDIYVIKLGVYTFLDALRKLVQELKKSVMNLQMNSNGPLQLLKLLRD